MQKKNQKKGFTLVELLVSVFMVLLILTIVGSAFTLNQKVFRIANTRTELLQNARLASDLIARELRQAKSIVTVLPEDNSDPNLVSHEIQFEDGHTITQIQYVRYYLDGTDLKRQIIAYQFSNSPGYYVRWNDQNAFGYPETVLLEEKLIGEYFNQINFYGQNEIYFNFDLEKNNIDVNLQTAVNPRNS